MSERALIQQMLEALDGVTEYVHNNLSSDYPTGVDTRSKEFDAADKAITAAKEYLAAPEQETPSLPTTLLALRHLSDLQAMHGNSGPLTQAREAVCELNRQLNRANLQAAMNDMPLYTHPAPQPTTPEQSERKRCCDHDSDCAVHNMPAYPAGPCDCSQKYKEPVGKVVSSGPADFPIFQWISADHSLRCKTGDFLYLHPAPPLRERAAKSEKGAST